MLLSRQQIAPTFWKWDSWLSGSGIPHYNLQCIELDNGEKKEEDNNYKKICLHKDL